MPPGFVLSTAPPFAGRADACIGLQLKFPTYGTDIPVLSFISAIRIMGSIKEVLDDAYKKVGPGLEARTFPSHLYFSIRFLRFQLSITGL